jgi:hypothetical protein
MPADGTRRAWALTVGGSHLGSRAGAGKGSKQPRSNQGELLRQENHRGATKSNRSKASNGKVLIVE